MRWIVYTLLAAFATSVSAAAAEVKTGPDAFGDWSQDNPGVRRLIRIEDLPKPSPGEASANAPALVERPPDAMPKLPDGFTAELVDAHLKNPRVIRTAPNGDLFVAESKENRITVLRLKPNSAGIERQEVFAEGLHQPYGIAFYPPGPDPQWVYVANSNSVVRFKYGKDVMQASSAAEEVVPRIPEPHHWTRDIAFSRDGKTLYLSVGSGSNVALDMSGMPFTDGGLEAWKRDKPLGAAWDTEERRADVLAFSPDGDHERIFATGLRNCSGLTIQPGTDTLWCVVNERDELGDNTPFEYATAVKEGAFYGWPWYYLGPNEDPRHPGARPDLKDQVTVPDVLMQAHSAPLQIRFYDGEAFPEEYRGDAFVTMHGSWNRGTRTGYKVVRLIFDNGKPTGEYEDFMTGFAAAEDRVWGRPVGLTVASDGALLVTEDGGSTLWRVTSKPKSSASAN